MDLHMAAAAAAAGSQPFSYYSCIMDNNAAFAAQHLQYEKMYGIDEGRRNFGDIDMGNQGTMNTRVLELRKEKSRDAARSRRGKENTEFYELAKMLPLPGAITSQLDKASIIRLTIAYLRLKEFSAEGDPQWNMKHNSLNNFPHGKIKGGSLSSRTGSNISSSIDIFEEHEGTHILQSLDGFAITLNSDARFLYISETVSIYLGLSQVELTGSSMFDYVHQSDHSELADQLGVNLAHHQSHSSPSQITGNGSSSLSDDGIAGVPAIPDVCYPVTSLMTAKSNQRSNETAFDRAFCIRMKSTLSKRGCHFKSSGYRVVLLLGKLRPHKDSRISPHSSSSRKGAVMPMVMGFIGLAIALPPPSVHEVRLENDMFVTRLNFDFKIAHCEPKVSELLDYTPEDLTGASMYSLCYGEDVVLIGQAHNDLLNKGQVMSNYYRLMNKNGGYTWMQSCATLICNAKNGDEQTIICVNYVLSANINSNVIMDHCQLTGSFVHSTTRQNKEEASEVSDRCNSSYHTLTTASGCLGISGNVINNKTISDNLSHHQHSQAVSPVTANEAAQRQHAIQHMTDVGSPSSNMSYMGSDVDSGQVVPVLATSSSEMKSIRKRHSTDSKTPERASRFKSSKKKASNVDKIDNKYPFDSDTLKNSLLTHKISGQSSSAVNNNGIRSNNTTNTKSKAVFADNNHEFCDSEVQSSSYSEATNTSIASVTHKDVIKVEPKTVESGVNSHEKNFTWRPSTSVETSTNASENIKSIYKQRTNNDGITVPNSSFPNIFTATTSCTTMPMYSNQSSSSNYAGFPASDKITTMNDSGGIVSNNLMSLGLLPAIPVPLKPNSIYRSGVDVKGVGISQQYPASFQADQLAYDQHVAGHVPSSFHLYHSSISNSAAKFHGQYNHSGTETAGITNHNLLTHPLRIDSASHTWYPNA